MNTEKRLYLNTITALANQVVLLITGFVIPRLIIEHYGSDVNGIVNSIKQFLQIIAFLELGVGAVVQSSLYSPIANNNFHQVSAVMTSGVKFFRKIGFILFVYVVILCFLFPNMGNNNHSSIYSITLILAISISYFAQYYFGLMDSFFLTATQKGYIVYFLQIITMILGAIITVLCIEFDFSIQVVQLSVSIIYLMRPFFMRMYLNKHYKINRHLKYKTEPIKQKWNGIAQHIAAVCLDSTDIVVLTIFSNYLTVSVYSVYSLVVSGVRAIITSATQGVMALLGEYWAKKQDNKLNATFEYFEWLINALAVLGWSCTLVLIVPFVKVYIGHVTDYKYYVQPMFAIIITLAYAFHTLRLPYNVMILAGGKYKETQSIYIWSTIINIFLSVFLVIKLGLIGVAIGTLLSMLYQTVQMANYVYRQLLRKEIKIFVKQIIFDVLIFTMIVMINMSIISDINNYLQWILNALITFLVSFIIVVIANLIFYKKNMKRLQMKIFNKRMAKK
ncbi:sugar isomerase [Limosilactobacillus fermentum]|uniref:lipopolysaccharide biosynthesis protein n=1 Tax=Limosilactobacillus fermentum TaxID=1613 RepID=UPI00124B1769|nr:polysaccharide biosynthesis C-terminal domain-containing protein [Limosilactobacillus fermentum]KAB1955476.1 sugar isomerase [Limosilactobacillus fermentum]